MKPKIAVDAREILYSFDGIQYLSTQITTHLFFEEDKAPTRIFNKYVSLYYRVYGPFVYENGFANIGFKAMIDEFHRPDQGNTILVKLEDNRRNCAVDQVTVHTT